MFFWRPCYHCCIYVSVLQLVRWLLKRHERSNVDREAFRAVYLIHAGQIAWAHPRVIVQNVGIVLFSDNGVPLFCDGTSGKVWLWVSIEHWTAKWKVGARLHRASGASTSDSTIGTAVADTCGAKTVKGERTSNGIIHQALDFSTSKMSE